MAGSPPSCWETNHRESLSMTTRLTDTTVNDHMQERVSGIKPGNGTAYISIQLSQETMTSKPCLIFKDE